MKFLASFCTIDPTLFHPCRPAGRKNLLIYYLGMFLYSGLNTAVVWSLYRLPDADVALMAKYNNGEITKEKCDQNLSHKY